MRGRKNTTQDFWDKILLPDPVTGCMYWTLATNGSGYGHFTMGGKDHITHILAYTLTNGPVPDGMELDHTCHTQDPLCPGGDDDMHRRCCAPYHLEAVDHRSNLMRSHNTQAWMNSQKTECVSHHVFDIGNTYIRPSGGRGCRTCRNAATKRYQERKRLELRQMGLAA